MAGYGDNVEIRVGSLEVDTNDVGNVKLFSHSPQREIHEVISGLTNSAIDVKEFINADTMKFTADHHVADKLRWYFGNKYTTIAGADVGRIMVAGEQITLSGSNEAGNRTLLVHGQGIERPISIECIQLTLQPGWTNFAPGDINLQVLGAVSGHTGNLVAYDNVAGIIIVARDAHADTFNDNENVDVTLGTGDGDILAANGRLPCGIFDDSVQSNEYDEHALVDDFTLDFYNGSVSRTIDGAIVDPQTVYIWYSYANPISETIKFPKGDTEVSTRGEYIYTKTLANGKTQEIKIPDGYITNMVEIPHSPGELTEYSVEVKSVEHAASVDYEHGYDKRTA